MTREATPLDVIEGRARWCAASARSAQFWRESFREDRTHDGPAVDGLHARLVLRSHAGVDRLAKCRGHAHYQPLHALRRSPTFRLHRVTSARAYRSAIESARAVHYRCTESVRCAMPLLMSSKAAVAEVGRGIIAVDAVLRFWLKVDRGTANECWLWTGAKNGNGYGNFSVRHGATMPAHRFSHALHGGELPAGLVVRHRCDVKTCVNPTHLTLGTQADNMADMVERGRAPRGDRHYMKLMPWLIRRGTEKASAKLTEADVSAIRAERESGASLKEISGRYGVSFQCISKIARGDAWGHVKRRTDDDHR